MSLAPGQVSDHRCAAAILPVLPATKHLLADKGYDSDAFRTALRDMGIEPCIPGRKNRKEPVPFDKALYKKRHVIENMFATLKDWRGLFVRYERSAWAFMATLVLAALVKFWL